MPVIPSFGNFAPTPNLAEAYLGGRRIEQGQQQINLQRQEMAQRAAIASQQMHNNRVMAEMEMAAKAAAQSQENLLKQQEMEMEKAYKDSYLGLQERQLQRQMAADQVKIDESVRKFAAQQELGKFIAEGGDPMEGALRFGPMAELPGSAYPTPQETIPFGQTYPVEGGGSVVQTGRGSGTYVPAPTGDDVTTSEVLSPEGERIGTTVTLPKGTKFVQSRPNPNLPAWRKEVDKLESANSEIESPYTGEEKTQARFQELLDPESREWKKAGPAVREQIRKYRENQERIAELKALIRKEEQPRFTAPKGPSSTGTNAVPRIVTIRRK